MAIGWASFSRLFYIAVCIAKIWPAYSLAHPVSQWMIIILAMKLMIKFVETKFLKSSLYVLVSLWDNLA